MESNTILSKALKIVAAGVVVLGSASTSAILGSTVASAASSDIEVLWPGSEYNPCGGGCAYCPYIPYEFAPEYSDPTFNPVTTTTEIYKNHYDSQSYGGWSSPSAMFLTLPDKFVRAGSESDPVVGGTFDPFDVSDETEGMTTRFLSVLTDDSPSRPSFIDPPDGTESITDSNGSTFIRAPSDAGINIEYEYEYGVYDEWSRGKYSLERNSWNDFYNEFFGNQNVDESLITEPMSFIFDFGSPELRLHSETGNPNWTYNSKLPDGTFMKPMVVSGSAVMQNAAGDSSSYLNWLLQKEIDKNNDPLNEYDFSDGVSLGFVQPVVKKTAVYYTQRIIAARYSVAAPDTLDLDSGDTLDLSLNDTLETHFGIPAYSIKTAPLHGSASLSGSVVSYTPDTSFAGNDTFEYEVTDPVTGFVQVASVTVTQAPALTDATPVPPTSTSCPATQNGTPTVILPSTTGVTYSVISQSVNNNGSLHTKVQAKINSGFQPASSFGSGWIKVNNTTYTWEGDLPVNCTQSLIPAFVVTPTDFTCSPTTNDNTLKITSDKDGIEYDYKLSELIDLSKVITKTFENVEYKVSIVSYQKDSQSLVLKVVATPKSGYELTKPTDSAWTSNSDGSYQWIGPFDIASCFPTNEIPMPDEGDTINPVIPVDNNKPLLPEVAQPQLAETGVNVDGLLLIGFSTLLLGAGLILVSKRKSIIEE